MEILQEKITVLPNPDVKREQCIQACLGCRKMFSDNNIGDVCISYINPKAKWRNYRIEKGTKKSKGKDVEVLYHLNPCNLANHIIHSPKMDEMKKRSGWKKGKKW